jgi:fructuronate reductase
MTVVGLGRSSWPATTRSPRIVHIGLGNFSRAHQAWYTMLADPSGQWGITAFTGRHRAVADLLARQDGLYTLIERGPVTDQLTVIDALCAARPGADLGALTSAIAATQTAVVTLTVTEAGYAMPSARAVGTDSCHESEAMTLSRVLRGEKGATELPSVPGRLVLALAARRNSGGGPLAIVSCDNLHANGVVLRQRTLALSDQLDPGLARWIEGEIAFVSTSVDRITPRTTDADRLLVQHELNRADSAPVVCEPFADWVLCGEFPAGRPRWEDAGARFVPEIDPWELRKLWLLNGGHSLLAYLGLLRGHETVAEAFTDPELQEALERFWDLAVRHLPSGDLDLEAYRRQLRERFSNGRIAYPLAQIAADGLAKLRNRVVPVIDAALVSGAPAPPALRVVAGWVQWLSGARDLGAEVDTDADRLRPVLALTGAERIRGLLELLTPGWASFDTLVDATEEMCAQLAGRQGTHT